MEAGLPNIFGSTRCVSNERSGIANSGAFATGAPLNANGADSTLPNVGILSLDASRCSQIYGGSDTVQPAAITLIWQIKVKL